MIYLIRAVGTEYVKIGVAKNPVARLMALQTGHPTKLAILAVADWPNKDERTIHRVLREYRANGEWFRSCDKIDSLIKNMHDGNTCAMWLSTFVSPPRLARILGIKQ